MVLFYESAPLNMIRSVPLLLLKCQIDEQQESQLKETETKGRIWPQDLTATVHLSQIKGTLWQPIKPSHLVTKYQDHRWLNIEVWHTSVLGHFKVKKNMESIVPYCCG